MPRACIKPARGQALLRGLCPVDQGCGCVEICGEWRTVMPRLQLRSGVYVYTFFSAWLVRDSRVMVSQSTDLQYTVRCDYSSALRDHDV